MWTQSRREPDRRSRPWDRRSRNRDRTVFRCRERRVSAGRLTLLVFLLMPSVQPIRILVADDQPDIVRALNLLLSDEGFAVTPASSPAEVLELIAASGFDLALVDLNYTRDTTS